MIINLIMVRNYILKRDLLYDILKCDPNVIIPTNDFIAWKRKENQKYLWVYNKLTIAQSQSLNCGPSGIKPNKFPVIIKPIINLHGMGASAYKINNLKEYKKLSTTPGTFWTEFLKGDHISIDIFLLHGQIRWYCAFFGDKGKGFGTFNYWKTLPQYQLDTYVHQWVLKNLKGYTGCINLEIIGSKIIECHLRMGDVNQIDLYTGKYDIFRSIINLYQYSRWTLPKNYPIPKIYQIPIFVNQDDYSQLNNISQNDLYRVCNKYHISVVQRDPHPDKIANPTGGYRLFCFTTDNLNTGLKCRTSVMNVLYTDTGILSRFKIIGFITVMIILIVLYYLKSR